MGFLLLQSRPGGEYLKALSWPAYFCGGFGIERQRERKFFCISKSVGFGELKLFHCPLALGVRGYCIYDLRLLACTYDFQLLESRC